MVKKLTLFAMSVGALVALAAPASAMAEPHFTHEGGAIPGGHIVVAYQGSAAFTVTAAESALGVAVGVSCPFVEAEVTIETHHAEVIEFFGLFCEGTDEFSNCQVKTGGVAGLSVGQNLPWTLDVTSTETLEATNAVATNGFANPPGCTVQGVNFPGASVSGNAQISLTAPSELGELELEGQLATAIGNADITGTLTQVGSTDLTVDF